MSQNKIDYPEQIYKAIDIITNKRLEALQYDITIEATIIDDKQSEKGVYTVSNGNANFIVYSKDSEYKKDDVVMITIPQGNYNNQKIIIGKKIDEEKKESPIEFKRPFSNLINITNNILSNNDQKKKYSFIANGEKYRWDITASDILQSSYSQEDKQNCILMDLSETGYTRIGVKADFLTTLKEYQVVSGNYGLEFILSFSDPNSFKDKSIKRTFSLDCKDFFGNVYNSEIYQTQELVFDISDLQNYILKKIEIYPYQRNNFKNIDNKTLTYPEGFSIEDNIYIKNIYFCLGTGRESFNKDSIKIMSKEGTFYVKTSDSKWFEEMLQKIARFLASVRPKPEPEEGMTEEELKELEEEIKKQEKEKKEEIINDLKNSKYVNIEPIKTIIKEEEISTIQQTQIQRLAKNMYLNKTLNAQWIHKNEDTNIIKMIQENEIPPKYHVWWYLYDKDSSDSDIYAGAGWKRLYGSSSIMNPKTGDHSIAKGETRENKIKEYNQEYDDIIEKNSNNKDDEIEELNLKYPEDITDHLENILFIPNATRQTQWLKVIIVKEKDNVQQENAFTDNSEIYFYDKIAESPIFVLENQNEVANKATKIEVSALSIRYEDKQKGMYSLYDEAGNISKNEDNQLRILSAVFDPSEEDVYEKPLLNQPYSFIKWIFPASNTMIVPIENILPSEIDTLKISTIKALEKPEINKDTTLIDGKYYIIKDKSDNDKCIIRYNNEEDTFEFLAEEIDSNEAPLVRVGYYIKNTMDYASKDNTVLLEILKEGSAYNTSVSMQFGKQGTSGSDYTLEVKWEKNLQPIFDISVKSPPEARTLSGQVILKDKDENVIDPGGGTYSYRWYKVFSNGKTFDFKKEERDIYYPVVVVPDGNGEKATGVDQMWREWNSYFDGVSGLYYYYDDEQTKNKYPRYWLQKDEVDTNQLATYDFIEKKFVKISTSNINPQYTIVYGKLKKKNDNEEDFPKKDIIEFRPIDNIVLTPYENGTERRCGVFEINEKGESIYYYYNSEYDSQYTDASGDKKRKVFIKYNDIYLIDPSPTYQENQTYYYPVYSNEKKYESSQILRIQDNGEGSFTITDDKDGNRTLSMDDLYILEISLDNFLEYPLIARFPISFRNNSDTEHGNYIVNTVEGPTDVRYSTSGEIDFKKNPYQISINVYDNKNNVYRTIKQGYGVDYNAEEGKIPFGHWELIYDNDFDNIDTNFLPSLIESSEINIEEYCDTFKKRLNLTSTNGDRNKQKEFLTLLRFAENETKVTHFSELNESDKNNKTFLSNFFDDCLSQLKDSSQKNSFKDLFQLLLSQNTSQISNTNRPIKEYYDTLTEIKIAEEMNSLFELLKKVPKHYLRDLKSISDEYNILRNKDLYFIKPYLLPSKVYFKDTPICGIKFVVDYNLKLSDDGTLEEMNPNTPAEEAVIYSNTTVWSSSIYFFQDNYPSKTLNQWNGKEVVTNKDLGIIQANGFSAGKKEPDNTFTGVILGDWSKDIADSFITKQTGIFGFNHGAMSYALKDDGTAFFGKDGKGRIYFDGTSAQIYSSKWIQPVEIIENNINTKTYNQQEQGMMLDVDDGILKIIGEQTIQDNKKLSFDFNIKSQLKKDSLEPHFLLNVTYPEETIDGKINGVSVRTINKDFRLRLASNTNSGPFFRIGHNVEEQFIENSDVTYADITQTLSYEQDYIRINDHGGWLASHNYAPGYYVKNNSYKMTKEFPDSPIDRMENSVFTTYVNSSVSEIRSLPMKGLVVDLTHGDIILGDSSSIRGYQTGKLGTTATSSSIRGTWRYFEISMGTDLSKIDDSAWEEVSKDNKTFLTLQKKDNPNAEWKRIVNIWWDGNITAVSLEIDEKIKSSNLEVTNTLTADTIKFQTLEGVPDSTLNVNCWIVKNYEVTGKAELGKTSTNELIYHLYSYPDWTTLHLVPDTFNPTTSYYQVGIYPRFIVTDYTWQGNNMTVQGYVQWDYLKTAFFQGES